MKSKASLKGHPLHPILIAFPLAFFIGTFLFDVLGRMLDKDAFLVTANYLEIAGVIGGLVAAVPGIIDYFFTIPPDSSAKKRGAQHGILNVTVVVLFAFAYLYRHKNDPSGAVILVAEGLGVVLLFISGWLGGTLVYRNQIGVDPRYANAGKWNEEKLTAAEHPVPAAQSDELQVNQMKLVHISNKRIVIARTEQGYVAFDDRCTHKGGSLAGGAMICGTVQCPWHGSQFDVQTGQVKAGPAKEKIGTYKVTEQEGKVYLHL